MPTKKSLKRNLSEKIFEEKTLPPTNLSNNFSTKNNLEKLYQGNSEETSPAKKISDQKSLPKNLSRELKKNLYEKNIWRKKNLPKRNKKHLHQKIWENNTRNMARIRTDEIWWNIPFLLNFISFDVCSFSSKEQLDFCWWIFLLKLFFVEISIGWIFWVEMPLQILFGRVFWFGWLRSLCGYLGKLLASNVFW